MKLSVSAITGLHEGIIRSTREKLKILCDTEGRRHEGEQCGLTCEKQQMDRT